MDGYDVIVNKCSKNQKNKEIYLHGATCIKVDIKFCGKKALYIRRTWVLSRRLAGVVSHVTEVVTNEDEYRADAYLRLEPITDPELQHVDTDMKGGIDNILAPFLKILAYFNFPLLHIINKSIDEG
ncbi:hypothetical protein J6590_084971, partial [Homalodisca vitripennis]